MRKATVRDLRYRFSYVEDLISDGKEVQITKRKRVIARLLPPAIVSKSATRRRPDFLARLKRVYGGKLLRVSGAELVTSERERF
jgi:antitoxin (DNA-binding transcriptional repressor) of toxin-antitoxin stability system